MNNSTIKLIVALANPGNEYLNTRHNAGQWVLDEFCSRNNISLKKDNAFFALVGKGRIGGTEVKVAIPTTYMNASGKAVLALAQFYKLHPEEILVLHDEVALEPGKNKFKFAGGHNGHNGLRDIHRLLGDKYWRLRVGIGHPGDKSRVAGYVLGKPSKEEEPVYKAGVDTCVKALEEMYNIGLNKVMNTFNA